MTDEKAIEIERDTVGIPCPKCNGYADRVDVNEVESEEHECGPVKKLPFPNVRYECCARAFLCRLCQHRHAMSAPAPECS